MPDNTLQFVPIEEVISLRYDEDERSGVSVFGEAVDITGGDGVAYEVKLVLDLREARRSRCCFI